MEENYAVAEYLKTLTASTDTLGEMTSCNCCTDDVDYAYHFKLLFKDILLTLQERGYNINSYSTTLAPRENQEKYFWTMWM